SVLKVTLCNNLTLFEIWFYKQPVLVHPQMNFDRIWSCEGQINTCVFPTSHPGYALCSSVYRAGIPCRNGRQSFHTRDIGSYTAKRHQLMCWQASISVSWAVGGVCKVSACLLGS